MTMLVMMLMSALLIALTTAVTTDQRYRLIDQDRLRAFHGALSGVEKLNADLTNLFFTDVAPSEEEIAALGEPDQEPDIPDVGFVNASGEDAYGVVLVPPPPGGTSYSTVTTGPYAGLYALKTTYDLDASTRTISGGEAHVRRRVETVAIPLFQFGMFSEVDLSYHAGPNFNFGGRVHSNANLFLAQGTGTTLTLPEKVTAVLEVIRQTLVNGVVIGTSGHTGTVRVATAPGAYRNLAATEGSVTGGAGSAENTSWPTISLSTYNSYIRDGTTGATRLQLPLIGAGGSNPDLVLRAPVNEDVSNPTLLAERYFSKVSLRVLLSDTAGDITGLPGVSATAPVQLDGNWVTTPPAGYGPVDATHPPIARMESLVTFTNTAAVAAGNAQNISVAAVPAYFRMPAALTITEGANVYTVSCTTKTGTRFGGCGAPAPAAAVIGAGATVSAVVATVDGNVNVSTTTTAAYTTANGFFDVVSTLAFAPNTFWVNNTNRLVTCMGYDTTPRFTGCNVPAAIANGTTLTTNARSNQGTGTIGGFLKIEVQSAPGTWTDVTAEILDFGIAGPNLNAASNALAVPYNPTGVNGKSCGDPNPDAIIRLQRLRDNGETAAGVGTCSYAASQRSTDYWPNVLFDPREALQRDAGPGNTNPILGGVIHYVTLDAANLLEWFTGAGVYAGGSGPTAVTDNGWSVYFSDRRNNRNAASNETGEYGFEDVVNPASGTGVPNATLETGEDVNASGALDTYGQFPSYDGASNTVPPGALAPLDAAARPTTGLSAGEAKVNRAILFRRALKLTNGSDLGSITADGLTIASENPVYVQGNWNAPGASFGNPHIATSIIADAITLLSSNWNDNHSFNSPYTLDNRARTAQSYYRFAVVAGKNAPFPRPTAGGPPQDFGTDGGAHNFLRMLETGGTVNYRGAIATFYFSRQAVGVYKCCATVYGAPTRNFNFDTDFLDPAKLPPLTPMFRDINSLGFVQETRPGR
jgi:hypothetical protein